MIFPSGRAGRTTQNVGWFDVDVEPFSAWLAEALGSTWQRVGPSEASIDDHIESVGGISAMVDTYVLLGVDGWTVALTNGPLGTDVGVLPSYAARKLDARAMRATSAAQDGSQYGSTILEVYEPGADDNPLHRRRTIAAANDGGTWRYEATGQPFDFEASDDPSRTFDRDALERYLRALGVPSPEPEHMVDAYRVTRVD